MLGLAAAARRKGTMEGKGVGFSAQWAELGLEGADAGIAFMPEMPAAVALGNACTTFGGNASCSCTTTCTATWCQLIAFIDL